MEPKSQFEIQLGHVCNNRCVFCTSGQRTALGLARPLPVDPVLDELRAAYAAGNRKVTLLGGEPTLARRFLDVVREAATLGYEEIVVFTNGVKTARASYVDELLAAAGPERLRLRFSFQGADEESHERTTRRPGSFARLLRSLEHAAARGVQVSVNLCAVDTNYQSLDRFPALFAASAITQLHVDMLRPHDAGERTLDELRAMMPRFSDMAPVLLRMVQGFPPGFDVNVGNVPYCVEPRLAPFIHHDGESTLLVSVDPQGNLQAPCDKYETKRERDKFKPEGCRACVLDDRCTGVTTHYRDFHGTGELVPLTREQVLAVDPERRLCWAPPPLCDEATVPLAPSVAARLGRLRARAPFAELRWEAVRARPDGLRVELDFAAVDGARAVLWLAASAPEVGYELRSEGAGRSEPLRRGLGAVFAALRAPSEAAPPEVSTAVAMPRAPEPARTSPPPRLSLPTVS